MYIVHVAPITRQIGLTTLSYFTFKEIAVGSVVDVPIRNKKTPALVVLLEDANAVKSVLRSQTYSTKNIKDPNPRKLLSSDFIQAINHTAKYFLTSVGSTINTFVPSAILKSTATTESPSTARVAHNASNAYEVITIQANAKERTDSYKTIIRSALARNESVLVVVPTINKANEYGKAFKKGIEKYVYTLHSALTPKAQRGAWQGALSEGHAVVIIVTYGFLSIPREDIGTIILDQEGSESYITYTKPKIDVRVLITKLAQNIQAKLILGDTLLRASTHKLLASGKATEFEGFSKRMRIGASVHTIDMGEYTRKTDDTVKQYPILSKEVKDSLAHIREHGGRMFILVNKLGHASQTVCEDCGTLVLCKRCGTPMTLYGKDDSRTFLCRTCGEARDAKTLCSNCGGWRLKSLGIGIEAVAKAVKEETDTKIIRVDSTNTRTKKQLNTKMEDFNNEKSCIMIGTTMAHEAISQPVDISVVASLDALLAIPDFNTEERTFRLILNLAENTKKKVLVQTRTPKNKMLKYATDRAIAKFVSNELELRKKFKYPPYATFIKISISGTREDVVKDTNKLIKILNEYKPRVFRAFDIESAHKHTLHVLVRYEGAWPNEELAGIIHSLPPYFVVQIT